MSERNKNIIITSGLIVVALILILVFFTNRSKCTYVDTSSPEHRVKTVRAFSQAEACKKALFVCGLYASKEHCKLKN